MLDIDYNKSSASVTFTNCLSKIRFKPLKDNPYIYQKDNIILIIFINNSAITALRQKDLIELKQYLLQAPLAADMKTLKHICQYLTNNPELSILLAADHMKSIETLIITFLAITEFCTFNSTIKETLYIKKLVVVLGLMVSPNGRIPVFTDSVNSLNILHQEGYTHTIR
ncbi:hypothetical protein BO94DRAFT_559571 [Aspergillus sclerotioniger CBS 115572]|uniref:Uncharacterized protein n=1 Tax=Aspergillus sclerotioniger CBS 115572 TaxID=1450535 RepID=A0A317VQV3_9EURO|nr:hypothetical protein BO94DRAFT_559571 [Aspergillus sclerotioniger CBS 115572]PWY75288.1 hypothetical protein BO94DRAFT_559571 [Aspergillus sclerotioniger CBS 115572]